MAMNEKSMKGGIMDTKTMCNWENKTEEELLAFVDEVIDDYQKDEKNLIQILHMAQAAYGYLPIELQKHIADRMDIPLSKVSGVVSFYTLFSKEKKGKYVIKICLGTACYVRGGKKIIARMKEVLGIDVGETSEDGRYSLEITRCIGACGLAPAMAINERVFMQVKADKLLDILDDLE
jgi:NADH:ubiquinone oxidoreductase subunit E